MSNALKIERIGSTVVVTFTRPEIRNPLSIEVLEELSGFVDSIGPDIAKLIFTGTGNVFASGANLREIAGVSSGNAREFARRGQQLTSAIAALSITTIAAVNGFCYGGALDLALACGKRVASPKVEFCHPGGGLGIMTGWGGTQRLPKLIGEAAALEMFLTGKIVRADEALRIGLVSGVAEDPLEAAIECRL